MTQQPQSQHQKYELTSLNLYKSYGDDKYHLSVHFKGYNNEIKLDKINGSLGDEILALCRDRLAEEIQRAVQQSLQQLIGITPTTYSEIEEQKQEDAAAAEGNVEDPTTTKTDSPDNDISI